MTLHEAIKHCEEVASGCSNTECSLEHKQLANWLIELWKYKKYYGDLEELHPSIVVTKSNLHKEPIRVEDIVSYDVCEGTYENNKYHTRIYCKNHTYYVIETVDEIAILISGVKEG